MGNCFIFSECSYWAGGGGCDTQCDQTASPEGVCFCDLDIDASCSGCDPDVGAAEGGSWVKGVSGGRTKFASTKKSVKRCTKGSPQHAFVLQHQIGSIVERCLQVFKSLRTWSIIGGRVPVLGPACKRLIPFTTIARVCPVWGRGSGSLCGVTEWC